MLLLWGTAFNIRNIQNHPIVDYPFGTRLTSDSLAALAEAYEKPNWELFEYLYDQYRGRTVLTNLENVRDVLGNTENKFVRYGAMKQVVKVEELPITGQQIDDMLAAGYDEMTIGERNFAFVDGQRGDPNTLIFTVHRDRLLFIY
jgi:hypothetical protein